MVTLSGRKQGRQKTARVTICLTEDDRDKFYQYLLDNNLTLQEVLESHIKQIINK
ncbi:MAG: hypothetical protein ACRC7R_05000 [Sarcina sp.]